MGADRPGSSGMTMFYPLRYMKEPPMMVMLTNARSSKDEVHYEDRLIVASIRTPVEMASLCRFISSAIPVDSAWASKE